MTRGNGSLALKFLLRLLLIACAFVSPAVANTIHVPQDQPTIQAGIDAANPGDTVLVAPGTYYENIDFKGKAITVTSSGGAAATIIDGGSLGPAVSFQSAEPRTAILSNFTIQHGGSITGNAAFNGNAGIWLSNSAPTLTGNVITQNMCWDIYGNQAGPLIQNNEISATQSPQYGCGFGSGAGIYIGGDFYPTSPGSPSIPALITGNTIENNVLSGLADAGGNGGGGIAVWGGSPVILNNILRNNASPGGSGGAINFESAVAPVVEQNLIYGNSAGCGGGALAFNIGWQGVGTSLLVANNTIANNTGTATGGFSECIAISQIYPFPDAYGNSGPTAVFVNNIISGSSSAPAVDCAWYSTPSEIDQPIFDHNILYNAGGAFFGSLCVDVSAKYGNIAADPQFNDPTNNDFHLKSTSPAIDSGNTSVLAAILALTGAPLTQDFDGNPRVQDATGKGYPIIDMGAYEFPGKVDANPTTVVLTSSAFNGPAVNNIVLTANVASPLGTPTGSVNYYLDGKPIGTSAIGNGGVSTLPNVSIAPGVHNLYASYPGEGSFPPAVSVILLVDFDLYATTLTLSSSSNPSILGQPVTFTIDASSAGPNYIPAPITLSAGPNNTTLATLTPNAAGVATYTTSNLPVGGTSIQASYAGDAIHAAASTELFQQVIDGYATTTTLTCQPASIGIGLTALLTASVTSQNGTPTGSIAFTDNGAALSTQNLLNGSASLTYTGNVATTHTITATYTPTGSFSGSSATCTEVVTALPTTSTLSATPTSATAGSPVALTVLVAPASVNPTSASPTGTVTFFNGASPIGTAPANPSPAHTGIATITLTNLPVGTDQLTCQYSGDSGYAASSCNTVPVAIGAIPTTLTLTPSPNPARAFQPIALSAKLTSPSSSFVAQGQISFFVNGASIGTAPVSSSGIATLTVDFPAGTDTLTANYASPSTCTCASAQSNPVTEVVKPDATTTTLAVSPNPATQNTAVTLTAQVTPASSQTAPTGSITFYDSATKLGSVPLDATGAAAFTSSSFAVGTHALTAVYSGSPNDLASTSAAEGLTINLQDFTLAVPPSLTIQTEYHANLKLTLTSLGSFADTIDLNCLDLPRWATCHFADTPTVLGPNQTVAASIDIQTDAVYDYKSELRSPWTASAGIAFAMLLPLGLLAGSRGRKLLRRSTLLATLLLTASLLSLGGCGGLYPPSVAPGTYAIAIAGQGARTGRTHTATLNLVVTP